MYEIEEYKYYQLDKIIGKHELGIEIVLESFDTY